jgi:hypothetical protein
LFNQIFFSCKNATNSTQFRPRARGTSVCHLENNLINQDSVRVRLEQVDRQSNRAGRFIIASACAWNKLRFSAASSRGVSFVMRLFLRHEVRLSHSVRVRVKQVGDFATANTFAKMLVENLFFDIVFIGFLNITKDSRSN